MNDKKPLWQRLSPVAAKLGVSPEVLESDIVAGRMPLRLARFGTRQIRHVRSEDVEALLSDGMPATSVPRVQSQL